MNNPRILAEAAKQRLIEQTDVFLAMPDTAGNRIHCLFAGLYVSTTTRWLDSLEALPEPDFICLVVHRFHELYDDYVVVRMDASIQDIPVHWRMYHRLARRLTMRSPISAHLALLALATRAHPRHDLSVAIARARADYEALHGHLPDVDQVLPGLIGRESASAFFDAAVDYVDLHRDLQRGWRWLVLSAYRGTLIALRPLWVTVLEGWRRKAWADSELYQAPMR